jgi:hypothetical protein
MIDKLNKAAAEVTMWRERVQKINADIVEAEGVVAASEGRRKEYALAASLGDDAARKHLDHVLQDDIRAHRDLENICLALPLAEAELRTAENAQRAAESEIRRAEKNRLARERVAAADKIDAALAAFSSAWVEYEQLGRELYSASVDRQDQIYLAEHFDGLLRLAASLPPEPFYSLRWRHSFANIGGGAPLAVSEAAFWRLPPVEAVKAA